MRTVAKVSVQTHITVKTDFVGVGECDRVSSCTNLEFEVLLESCIHIEMRENDVKVLPCCR